MHCCGGGSCRHLSSLTAGWWLHALALVYPKLPVRPLSSSRSSTQGRTVGASLSCADHRGLWPLQVHMLQRPGRCSSASHSAAAAGGGAGSSAGLVLEGGGVHQGHACGGAQQGEDRGQVGAALALCIMDTGVCAWTHYICA